MGACIKSVSDELSTELIVFFRNFFGFLILLAFLLFTGNFRSEKNVISNLATEIPWWHIARSLLGLGAMYCFFYSIAHIPLAESVLLSYTTPLFAPFLAYLVLKERFSVQLFLAITLGFVGVIFLLNPEFKSFSWVSLIALCSGFFASAAMISIRKMSKTEPTTRIVFYYGLICTSVSAIPLLGVDQWPNINALLTMVAVGIFATLGQLSLTKGYSMAAVAHVGPFVYSTVVFATIIAWFFWQEVPTFFTGFGILLVVIGGSIALRQVPVYNAGDSK